MAFFLFLFFIWLILLTIQGYSLRKTNRALEQRVWELNNQLQQLQRESVQKPVESEETVQKDPKPTVQPVEQQPNLPEEKEEPASKPDGVPQPSESKLPKEKPEPSIPEPPKKEQKPSIPVGGEERTTKVPKRRQKKRWTGIDWELLVGGRWLNRIGAVAIIIGLIFFVKYAFDHDLINAQTKVVIVGLIGALFLWGGRYFYRKKLPIFAQGLIGAGVAILYLAVYAAHNVYHLLSGTWAFGWMILVTVLAFQQALAYNALAISLLGWCGGYLTPFLVTVEKASTTGLFLYLIFLSLGLILVTARKQNWSILYHLTLVATYAIFFLYQLLQPEPSEWSLRIGFLLIFWLIFYGYELYYLARSHQWSIAKEITAAIHSLFLYIGLHWLLDGQPSIGILISLTLAGIAYLLPLLILHRRGKLSQVLGKQVIRYGLTFCLFVNLAPLTHWERFELILIWIIHAALFMGWAVYKRLQWLTIYTMGLLSVASLVLIALSAQPNDFQPVFNLQFIAYLGLTGVYLFGAIRQQQNPNIRSILHIAWATLFLIGFSFEFSTIQSYIQRVTAGTYVEEIQFLHGLLLFTSWIVYSLFLTQIAIWKQIRSLMITSWVFLGLGLFCLSLTAIIRPFDIFPVVFWSRFTTFLISILVVYFHYRWHQHQERLVALVCLYAGIFLGFELLTLQINDYFNYQIASLHSINSNTFYEEQQFNYNKWVFLWISWTLYSLLLLWYGWRRKINSLIDVSKVFYALCMFGVLIHGLKFKPLWQFVPVWNFRFVMLLIAMLVSYGFYRYFRKYEKKKPISYLLILLLLGFELIHTEVNDYFRYQLMKLGSDILWKAEAIKFTQPLSLVTLWILFSLPLTWLGLKYRRKWLQSVAGIVLGIGLFLLMIFSFAFSPIDHFRIFINQRSLFLLIAVAVVLIHIVWYEKKSVVRVIGSIIVSILLFELITVELNDFFRLLIHQDPKAVIRLLNLRQLSFSFAWILYAILLFAIGLWRKFPLLRWIAMGLFGVSVFKIFLYDLTFLDTLYRIILFIGLGIALLLVSYIYQRYKHLFTSSDNFKR